MVKIFNLIFQKVCKNRFRTFVLGPLEVHVGWVKIGHFRRKMRYNSKTVQYRRIVSIKVE